MQRSTIRVEGRDDMFALVNLLIRHGVDYDSRPWPAGFPEFQVAGSVTQLLDTMAIGVQVGGERTIGFVLDADSPLVDRWQGVSNRLQTVDVDVPKRPPTEGFVGKSATYNCTVGVWLMPDNQQDGKLETFLQTLIHESDPLIDHATSATDTAKRLGGQFTEPDRIKAVLHAWLAWQREPGRPYGTAIKAKYFQHESRAARTFVVWFKSLFGID